MSRLSNPFGRLAIAVLAGAASILASGPSAQASELRFQFVSPSFGGYPGNTTHLFGQADRQNKYDDADRGGGAAGGSMGDQFARRLESQLYAGLATQITNALFGENPQQSGEIQFGSQTITFVRGLTSISIDIFDSTTGSTTHIEVPVI